MNNTFALGILSLIIGLYAAIKLLRQEADRRWKEAQVPVEVKDNNSSKAP